MIEEDLHNEPVAESFSPELAELTPENTSGRQRPGSGGGKKSPRDDKRMPREKKKLPKSDKYIWAVYIALLVISIVEQYSASSREISASNVLGPIIRHCALLLLGLIITLSVSRIPYKWFIPLSPIFVLISVLAMIYVLINPSVINGAARSFSLMGIQVQPAEFIKISSVLVIAFVMSMYQKPRGVKTRGVVICGVVVLIFGGLLFSQGLTNTLLMMGVSLTMMLIAGVEKWKFGVLLLAYALAGGGGIMLKMHEGGREDTTMIAETGRDSEGKKASINRAGTWNARIDRFKGSDSIPKWEQPINDANRQEMYAYMAQANGGIFGVMPGNSRETARLPLANIDFVYSIVIEDTGLIGGVILLLLYLSLLGRAGALASMCRRVYPALLVMGMAIYIVLQAMCHMAIVTGVVPVSGQPLPLISKGGSSIIVTSLAFGIMLSVSRYATRRKATKQEVDREGAELPDNLSAPNPTQL